MEERFTIIAIDDEENILKALKRLFRNLSMVECITTTDPYEAEEILKKQPVDLIICDERMPKVSGHAFLAFVKERYPFTVRIIITGYSDPEVLTSAINRGEVYRFIQKPWDDEELLVIVRRALEHGKLLRDHNRLEEELKRKNHELEQMNNKLEALVQRRTSELQKTLELLKDSRDRAVGGFRKSANLLSSMIHLFQRDIGNHARRVALLCEQMIPLMQLQGEDARNLMMAAYFHEIGKVGRQDTGDEPVAQEHYAEIGENLISQGMGMKDIGTIIRHHREHFDGSGQPDGLAGEAIPLASRILKVLAEYDWMIHRDGKSVQDALAFLLQHSEQLYDPLVVTRFHQLLRESGETNSSSVPLKDLKPGMELMSDIFLKDGVLFLPGKTVITAEILERIDRFRDLIEERKGYYIRPEHEGSDTHAGEQKKP
ncbi:HD domain-containing phosphohydrolase [Sediminispirochaeta bajacaliforniensis]|uniref:HD domain-containing phosphohydrolase n=1 Tax=Sediminispirochaeta bajacaliforniensis TaxID=148 RepID=UPI00037676D2|nr:HD domain-containing phosphohydrolase [Sediminispirochaeta bajacaliforniensis]